MSYLYGLGDELNVDERKGNAILKYVFPRLLQMQDDNTFNLFYFSLESNNAILELWALVHVLIML